MTEELLRVLLVSVVLVAVSTSIKQTLDSLRTGSASYGAAAAAVKLEVVAAAVSPHSLTAAILLPQIVVP
jgi:ABC-type phosphate transport system permease subunit